MMRRSAIYTGRVRHRRMRPAGNEFTYGVCLFYLDLDEIPAIFSWPGLLSHKSPALFAFHRKNYLGDRARTLSEAVRDRVEKETGRRPQGPIRLLTQISYLGYCFNPVSFYYCFDAAGENVEFIVAEITNTPWNERHAYVLACRGAATETFEFPKAFHVSPFMSMDLKYRWFFSAPDERLLVHMENFMRGDAERFFDATLTLERGALNPATLARALLLYPLMTVKTVFLIHFQAIKLWMKRVPFHPHPSKGVS